MAQERHVKTRGPGKGLVEAPIRPAIECASVDKVKVAWGWFRIDWPSRCLKPKSAGEQSGRRGRVAWDRVSLSGLIGKPKAVVQRAAITGCWAGSWRA